jgi:hypothetical protein
MTKIETEMLKALGSYTRPVIRCPPGRARAPEGTQGTVRDDASKWLKAHRGEKPVIDPQEIRKRVRIARAEKDRIATRNASVKAEMRGAQKKCKQPHGRM